MSQITDRLQIRLCSTALLLVISGCAGQTAVQQSNTTPPPPVTSHDGSYRSTIRVTGMSRQATGTNWCDTPGQPVIVVANGQFNYAVPHPNVPGNPAPVFSATIAPDGSFSGGATNGTIAGSLSGTHIEGRIDGEGCIYAFTGDRM
jgi:hypothetical protein